MQITTPYQGSSDSRFDPMRYQQATNRSTERFEGHQLGSARIGQDYGRHLEQQADQAKLHNDVKDEWHEIR
jgi:hypothetical protein